MPIAPGYLLTWHTYGTWLHGDPSGSVDPTHNTYGTPQLPPDPERFGRMKAALADPPLELNYTARILVDSVIRGHCRIRVWNLAALASDPTTSTPSSQTR